MVNKTAFLSTSYLISAKSIYHPRLEVENVINKSTVKDVLCLCLEQFSLHLSSPAACPPITQGKKLNIQIVIIYLEDTKKNQTESIFIHLKKSPVYDRRFIRAKLADICLREMLLLSIYSFVLLSVKLSSGVFETAELQKLLQKSLFFTKLH